MVVVGTGKPGPPQDLQVKSAADQIFTLLWSHPKESGKYVVEKRGALHLRRDCSGMNTC